MVLLAIPGMVSYRKSVARPRETGGKGFVLLTGDVASTETAVTVGARVAGRDGILVDRAVIPRPSKELFKEFV